MLAPAAGAVSSGMAIFLLPAVTFPAASVIVPVKVPTATSSPLRWANLVMLNSPSTLPVPSCSVPVIGALRAVGFFALAAAAFTGCSSLGAAWLAGAVPRAMDKMVARAMNASSTFRGPRCCASG